MARRVTPVAAGHSAARGEGGVVVAAGAVVWRDVGHGTEVCLVHRPRYDDWSLPKGKLEAGEDVLAAAVREVAEETGHQVALGRPLTVQRYDVEGRPKVVHYWAARADNRASPRPPDGEIDDVVFVPATDAVATLTHPRDADLVAELVSGPLETSTLVVLRHAKAMGRSDWSGADLARPLDARGRARAAALVPSLAALGISQVVSSDAVRCVDTVRPYTERPGVSADLQPLLSEEGFAATGEVRTVLTAALRSRSALICSHRPVLPALFDALGIEPGSGLKPGSFVVAHHCGGVVIAAERHDA